MSFFIHHAYLLWTYHCKPSRENEDDVVKSQTDEEKSLSSISCQYIHSLHAFCIHRWHPFFIPSVFLLVSCLFSFIMLSCCEENQFVNERSKRGRRRTLRPTTVSFSLRLSSVSCVCGAFLAGLAVREIRLDFRLRRSSKNGKTLPILVSSHGRCVLDLADSLTNILDRKFWDPD